VRELQRRRSIQPAGVWFPSSRLSLAGDVRGKDVKGDDGGRLAYFQVPSGVAVLHGVRQDGRAVSGCAAYAFDAGGPGCSAATIRLDSPCGNWPAGPGTKNLSRPSGQAALRLSGSSTVLDQNASSAISARHDEHRGSDATRPIGSTSRTTSGPRASRRPRHPYVIGIPRTTARNEHPEVTPKTGLPQSGWPKSSCPAS